MEVKRILVGMNRPTRNEVYAMLRNRGVFFDNWWCSCMSPEMFSRFGSIEGCYSQGHYDSPVYKFVWEEGGKIVESLTEPKGEAATTTSAPVLFTNTGQK